MNLCTTCQQDFGSVAAFDRHRVGVHAYTFSEGMRMVPPRDDGRRCLDVSEIEALLDKHGRRVFVRSSRGTWSLGSALEGARRRFRHPEDAS